MSKQESVRLVDRHAAAEGVTETPLEGLRLFRVSGPVERIQGVYRPSACGLVQGRKCAYLNGTPHVYDDSHYLSATMPTPVEGEVPEATKHHPVLGFMLDFESRVFRETVIAAEVSIGFEESDSEVVPGLWVTPWDEPFAEALLRVLQLLDDQPALKVLGDARMKELAFAILRGGAGYSIRRALGGAYELSRAVNYLKDNLHENISIDDLAKRAGMSRAVFHRKFKEATTYSPIQFIKALRLNNAAMLIAGGSTAGEAAYQVGYTSQSQFSREFRRHFGRTPRQWGGSMGPAREKLVAAAGS